MSSDRAYERLFALSQQLVPRNVAGDSIDPFSVESLRAMAASRNYTIVTPEIIAELRACVATPDKQVVVDQVLLSELHQRKVDQSSEPIVKKLVNKRQASDRSHFDPIPAAVVVYPNSTEETSNIMKVCFKHRVAITPSGTRTGLEGASLSIVPGVVLDMSRMDNVLKVCRDEMLIEVQPGIEKVLLNNYLKKQGLFFAVDPGSNACMGGYANTGASGTLSIKYGTMRENCRSMTVVLADGSIMTTRTRAPKTSAGYNLHQLLIGSEGTLGIVTELVLKVIPIPKLIVAARVRFNSTFEVSQYVCALAEKALNQVARVELLNASMMFGVNKYSKTKFPELPTLFLEFHGQEHAELDGCLSVAQTIAQQCGSVGFESTYDTKEIDVMWQARRDAYFASFHAPRSRPAMDKARMTIFMTDVCVPLPKLPILVQETEKDFAENSYLPCPLACHAAEGNTHFMIAYDANNHDEVKHVMEMNDRLVLRALNMGGTCTGEHGVGIGKMKFLVKERGPVAMRLMREIKNVFDVHGILNPYKVFTPVTCEDRQHCHH